MRDWVVASLLGLAVVCAIFMLPLLVAVLSLLLVPALYLIAAILVIWFLLQIFKDGGSHEGEGGPDA